MFRLRTTDHESRIPARSSQNGPEGQSKLCQVLPCGQGQRQASMWCAFEDFQECFIRRHHHAILRLREGHKKRIVNNGPGSGGDPRCPTHEGMHVRKVERGSLEGAPILPDLIQREVLSPVLLPEDVKELGLYGVRREKPCLSLLASEKHLEGLILHFLRQISLDGDAGIHDERWVFPLGNALWLAHLRRL